MRSNTLTDDDIQAIEQLSSSVRHFAEKDKQAAITGVQQQKVDTEELEKRVQQL